MEAEAARGSTAGAGANPDAARGSTAAIVVGAGAGRRLGGVDKAFLTVGGQPLLAYSVDVLERTPEVNVICLVVGQRSLDRAIRLAQTRHWRKVAAVVPGGRERQDSVRAGLDAVARIGACEWLVIHDAARPLITQNLVRAGVAAAQRYGAAVAAHPVRDTLKCVHERDGDRFVWRTVDRSALWAAQTPQVFRRSVLSAAFAAGPHAATYTDDASLVEAMGQRVCIFAGGSDNIKVTLPEDVPLVEALLRSAGRSRAREASAPSNLPSIVTPVPSAGTGYDIHRLVPGRRLVLGGVEIESPAGLAGHSDGDVLTHAVIDALFGACGLPDIGQHFPPDDPRYAGADSLALLSQARREAEAAGWRPCSVDATVVCERPKLAPFLSAMRSALAAALALPAARVNVKAKTNEGLDAVGRGEAIAAHAILLVVAGES